jgi:hypothetical protein
MIQIEFLSLQGKPKHTTCQGTPSQHTSTIPIDSPFVARAHRLGIQCSTDPGCRRAVTALVPTIASMGDPVSGQVRWKVCAGFTQVLGLPVTIFPDMCLVRSNAWLRYPHINPYFLFLSHGQGILPGSKSIDHHRSCYQDEYNQFRTSREC